MNMLISFGFFSFSIFISYLLLDLSKVRIERRLGLSRKPFTLIIKILPSYIKLLPLIVLLFISSYLSNFHYFPLFSLLIILLTKLSISSKAYGYDIINGAAIVSIIVVTFVTQSFSYVEYIIVHNPFSFLSFIVGLISISILNENKDEAPSLNISRNLALNIYLISLFTPKIPFIITSSLAVVLIYIQFLIKQITPKFNIFQNMRYTLSLILSSALITFIGNLIWLILSGGRSISTLY